MENESSHQIEFFDKYVTNSKITIIKKYTGINAVNKAKKLFFRGDKKEAELWLKNRTINEKKKAIFFVYVRRLQKSEKVGFKFVIGDYETSSVVGEEHNYKTGIILFKQIVT
jgi:hypothetical protein